MNASTAPHDLYLNLLLRLQLIGVREVEQLRILLAMDDKTRSQIVTTLRRARSKRIAVTNTTGPEIHISKPSP